MALNATTLGAAIETAFKQIDAENDDTRKLLAEAIATEVINHIKSNGVITVAAGIPVTVAVPAGTGATTSTGTGTIA